jgi:ankyrin repeat protein
LTRSLAIDILICRIHGRKNALRFVGSDHSLIDDEAIEAARRGDDKSLSALLDRHPDILHLRADPYEFTLLHIGARHLPVVDLLLRRGLNPNEREKGDNTYAMHWAAAAGELEVVRRLADAGGDVIGSGDDHGLEVIGWATCWDGCDDEAHRRVVDFLRTRGARHHIFSAIAMTLGDEVRRIVTGNPGTLNQRMSRNENHQLPLHFAVRKNLPKMVALLIELGADPLGVDGSGYPAAAYATSPEVDRAAMTAIAAMTADELESAARGKRDANLKMIDLLASLALRDLATAEKLWNKRSRPDAAGLLHVMSKRGDVPAVEWLLNHGMDPDELWPHWSADVTPLHLAALAGHVDVAGLLVDRGARADIRDSEHNSTALEWAQFFGRIDVVRILSETS